MSTNVTVLQPQGPPFVPQDAQAPIDVGVLAQMANAMFSALPGASSSPAASLPPGLQTPVNVAPGGSPLASPSGLSLNVPGTFIPLGAAPGANLIPSSPTPHFSLANRVPSMMPKAEAGNGVPDHVFTAVPGYEPHFGSAVTQAVPQASEAVKAASYASGGVKTETPYYFANDGYGYPSPGRIESNANVLDATTQVDDDLVAQALSNPQSRIAVPAASGKNVSIPATAHPFPVAAVQPVLQETLSPQGFHETAPLSDSRGYGDFVTVPDLSSIRQVKVPSGNVPDSLLATTPASGISVGNPQYYFVDAVVLPSGYVTPAKADPYGHPPLAGQSRHALFDVLSVRRDFPILQERVNGHPLIWFDNAATTQKPQAVIDRLSEFYAHENSNIHRAAHELAARATDAYEDARETVRNFINAPDVNEVIFVRGTTEAINLVAKSWGWQHVGAGDEIIVSHLEHHANIVPWQQLAAAKGARLRVIPVDDDGQVLLDEYQKLLNDRTKIVAVTQVSNALGTVVPVRQIIELAKRAGARTLVDGAQSIAHMQVDVQALGADFFVFSGHKIFGPTGIGVVWGKREVLEDMPPWQGGGNMIADVTFEKTVFQPIPNKFEAGTGNIADAVGLGAALKYVSRLGLSNIARYEHDLLVYGTQQLRTINGLRLIGTAPDKASVLSFILNGYTTDEVGQALNREGIAVRTGHHCAQPILRRFGLETTVRPSLAFYNTFDEIDSMVRIVHRLASARR